LMSIENIINRGENDLIKLSAVNLR
jgi:hypothetical protein